MRYDFIAIGDITTDAFVKLKDARVHCDINDENCQICMNFGDKIPYESLTEVAAVGNSPNAAVSAHRLGLATALVTNLGNDRHGDDCIAALKTEGIPTEFVQVHPDRQSNYHIVLSYEAERTILLKQTDFPYVLPDFGETPRWIYFSSVGESALDFHDTVAQYITEHPETKLAFQPGTFQISLGAKQIASTYQATELFFCNKEEAQRILETKEDSVVELITMMRKLGPKQVVITDGRKGSHAGNEKGVWHVPIYPDPKPPVERTGAGDATASATTAFVAQGMSLHEALMRGHINSMSVVQEIGAQKGLLTAAQIDEYIRKAPVDFKPTKLA